MQEKTDSNIFDNLFNVLGLISGIVLTGFDFYTSFLGIRSFASPEASEVWRFYLPASMSGITIAFNACSALVIEQFIKNQENSAKAMIFTIMFFVSVAYDAISSFFGTLAGMQGEQSAIDAFQKASGHLTIFAACAACLMLLGPFMVGKFFHMLKNSGGMIGTFPRTF